MILVGMSVSSLGLPKATVCCRKSNGLVLELYSPLAVSLCVRWTNFLDLSKTPFLLSRKWAS